MRGDVGFVQCGGVKHSADAAHGFFNEGAVGDGADAIGESRGENVDAKGIAAGGAKRAHERFTEMSGATGDQDGQIHSFDYLIVQKV